MIDLFIGRLDLVVESRGLYTKKRLPDPSGSDKRFYVTYVE